jgi:long-subunit acyl-CoA synthetase (AMP-forming)
MTAGPERFVEAWTAALAAYGDRPYVTQPAFALRGSEAGARVRLYAAALMAHGVNAGDTVAFYGQADAEWFVLQHAVLRAGGSVALVPHSEDETALAKLLAQCRPKYVLASTELDAERCLRCMRALPEITQTILQHGAVRNPGVVSLAPLVKGGELYLREKADEVDLRARAPAPDDIAVIAYSTGTLGFPRSVAVSHARFENQVRAVAERLGPGPALFSDGALELIDSFVLLHAGVRAGRELCFAARPERPWEWVAAAPALADALFSVTWPAIGPQALPKGFAGWRLRREVARYLKANFPHLRGVHTGFSVLPDVLVAQLRKAGLRVTWGYGLTEAHGFATWEENAAGFGSLLPQVKLAMHGGKLVFDFADSPTAWWQQTGDWARTVGPWIQALEPHGSERGEAHVLANARKVEHELCNHPWIYAAFVTGPEPMAHVALLSLRMHPVVAWAATQGFKESWESLLERPELTEPLFARVRAIGHRSGVALEPILLKRGFSAAGGEVTLRGELRRALIMRRAGQYVHTKRPAQ